MCGIVGYIGHRKALPILLEGIKNLEYRGYDSAGIAISLARANQAGVTNRDVWMEKSVGRVANLEKKIGASVIDGGLGIVHSRWATHGGVTETNAHPHTDCNHEIYLVHNGIIENYKEIRDELLKRGHKFSSETDTEVLTHFIEEFYKKRPVLEDAVRLAMQKVRGTYGLAVFSKREPDKLIAVRNFSPLLLGIGEREYFIASDASAILNHTRKVIYLNDGELAVLTPESYKIYDINKKQHKNPNKNHSKKLPRRIPQELEWDMETIQKGGHEHFMEKEIFEQPEAITNSIRGRLLVKEGNAVLGGLSGVLKELKNAKRILISACGTAYLASRVGEYMLEEFAGVPVEVDIASEFRYRKQVFSKGDVMFVISQSGETADTLAALKEAKKNKVLALGIVNAVGSTIARETDAGVYQHVGPEIAVASTKAFTSQVSILALLALLMGRERKLDAKTGKVIVQAIKNLPSDIKELLKSHEEIKKIAQKYSQYNNFLYLGRKYNLPAAMEGALKLKEISYVHAEGMGAGEMKHGSIAMIDQNFPSVFIAPQDSVYEKNISNIEEIKARGGPLLAVATKGDKNMEKLANDVIYIPKTIEMLYPILSVIALQLFAYYFAVERGCDVDKPRNLAKSVTVE